MHRRRLALVVGMTAALMSAQACAGGDGRPDPSGELGYRPGLGGVAGGEGQPETEAGASAPGSDLDAGGPAGLEAGQQIGEVVGNIPGAAGLGATGTGDDPAGGVVNPPNIPGGAGLGAGGRGQVDAGPIPVDGGSSGVIVVF